MSQRTAATSTVWYCCDMQCFYSSDSIANNNNTVLLLTSYLILYEGIAKSPEETQEESPTLEVKYSLQFV